MEEKGFPKEKIREEMLRLEQMRKQILRPGFLELGLTLGQGQPRILRTLFLQEPLKQRELARRCGLDVTTMSRTLDRMAETGLIERRTDPNCRRSFLQRVYGERAGNPPGISETAGKKSGVTFRGFSGMQRG